MEGMNPSIYLKIPMVYIPKTMKPASTGKYFNIETCTIEVDTNV